MRVIGVDPGALGAMALLDGFTLEVEDMPALKMRRGKTDKNEVDGPALAELLQSWMPVDAFFIELVGGIQGQSASAAFNFGLAAGVVRGAAHMAGCRVEIVPTTTWKRATGVKLGAGKDPSRSRACQLWPRSAALFRRVKDADRAEAALIAEYGRRLLGGEVAAAVKPEELFE